MVNATGANLPSIDFALLVGYWSKWSATGANLRFAPVADHPQFLSPCVSQREVAYIRREPFEGQRMQDQVEDQQIDLGGRLLEQSSTTCLVQSPSVCMWGG